MPNDVTVHLQSAVDLDSSPAFDLVIDHASVVDRDSVVSFVRADSPVADLGP